MTKAAAFSAAYTDWKLIRTRSVVQIVFEVPIEKSREAYDALGGMPTPAAEVWCGICRLQEPLAKEVIEKPRPPAARAPQSGGAHRSWHEMSPAQQAGMLCNEVSFVNFLKQNYREEFNQTTGPANQFERAAQVVRDWCGVVSRRHIQDDDQSGTNWRLMVSDYRAYMREPEVVPI